MPPRNTLGELLELAGVADPQLKRRARRAATELRGAGVKLQRDFALLGELDSALQNASAVRYEETAPGVHTPRPPRLAEIYREVRKWQRSR